MEKIYLTKSKLTVASILMMLALILILPLHVSAESSTVITFHYSKKGNAKTKTYTFYTQGKKMTSITSSDPSIATASFENVPVGDQYTNIVSVKFKKTGTVLIKEYREGESTESSFTIKAVPYKAPVKSLKFGKKDFSKKIGKSYRFEGKPFSGKVTFKKNKGWKFKKIYKFKTKELLLGNTKLVPLKKNGKIKLGKGERLVLQFSKGNDILSITYTGK